MDGLQHPQGVLPGKVHLDKTVQLLGGTVALEAPRTENLADTAEVLGEDRPELLPGHLPSGPGALHGGAEVFPA